MYKYNRKINMKRLSVIGVVIVCLTSLIANLVQDINFNKAKAIYEQQIEELENQTIKVDGREVNFEELHDMYLILLDEYYELHEKSK